MAISNFFTAFYSALADAKTYYELQKEMNVRSLENVYLNLFTSKTDFTAVVLAVNPGSTNSMTQEQSIRVRPLDLHDYILPEPCSINSRGARKALIALHPVAYSAQTPTSIGTADDGSAKISPMSIRPGDLVTCKFNEGPGNNGKMRGLYFESMTRGSLPKSNMDLKCLRSLDTSGAVAMFSSGGYVSQGAPLTGNYNGIAGNHKIENGKLNKNILGKTRLGVELIKDAISDLDDLAEAFEKKFKKKLLYSGYRPYQRQVELKIKKPNLAAKPGTSNHGWGVAIDINTKLIGSNLKEGFMSNERYKWLFENAGRFNWEHPLWAQEPDAWPEVKRAASGKKGSKPESWHWEWIKKDTVITGLG